MLLRSRIILRLVHVRHVLQKKGLNTDPVERNGRQPHLLGPAVARKKCNCCWQLMFLNEQKCWATNTGFVPRPDVDSPVGLVISICLESIPVYESRFARLSQGLKMLITSSNLF